MKRIIPVTLAVAFLGCAVFAQPDVDVSMNAVSTVITSPDERFIAAVDETTEGRVVHIFTCCASSAHRFSITTEALSKFIETPHIESVHWSSDGTLLKLELSDRDEDHVAVVVDPRAGLTSLRAVNAGGAPAAWGSWSFEGHRLFVVPSAPDDDGIYIVDPVAGTSKRLMSGYKVATDLSVTKKTITTKVEETKGDSIGYSLVSVDVVTGTVKKLF